MTTLLIQTESTPMTINLPAIAPVTHELFYEFCLANRDLRIERTAGGDVVIVPPASSDTGNRNLNIVVQLGSWVDQDRTWIWLQCRLYLAERRDSLSRCFLIKLERWNTLTEKQKASFAPICPDFVIELRSSSVREASPKEIMLTSLQDKI